MATEWRTGLHGPIGSVGSGSFRGVNFFVRQAKSKVGRKVVIHEFPGADEGSADDLGKRVRRYNLECFVLGGSYMDQRDKLVKEFEKPGPGLLIHPFWGTFIVTVESDVEVEESWENGGMAKFSLAVAQVGTLAAAFQLVDTYGSVLSSAAGLLSAASDAFAAAFTVVGAVNAVVQDAVNAVNAVATVLNQVKGSINAVMQTIDDVADSISSIANNVTALVQLPGQLAGQLSGAVTGVINSVKNIGAAWSVYFGSGESASTTSNPSLAPTSGSPASADARAGFLLSCASTASSAMSKLPAPAGNDRAAQQISQNQAAMRFLVGCSVAASTAQTAAALPYGSSTAALNMRSALIAQIDALTFQALDDASYMALCDLRASVHKHLTDTAANLPQVVNYIAPQALPALVLAQQLYGSPDRAEDIVSRNDVIDPTAVPGGVALEVLSG